MQLVPPPFLPFFFWLIRRGLSHLAPTFVFRLSACSFVNGCLVPPPLLPPPPSSCVSTLRLLCVSEGPRLGLATGRDSACGQRTRRARADRSRVPAQSTLVPLLPVPSLLLALSTPDLTASGFSIAVSLVSAAYTGTTKLLKCFVILFLFPLAMPGQLTQVSKAMLFVCLLK